MTLDFSNHTDLLRWWHQYQAQVLNHEADLIRNGVLQDVVAIRRSLELSCQTQTHAEEFGCETHLAELKRIYTLLESLCNRLEAPYLQDSLPLALQYTIQPWQEKIQFKPELPNHWEPEPVEYTRLLNLFADRLLALAATADIPVHHCHVALRHQAGIKELTFHVRYEESLPVSLTAKISRTLEPFLSTFQILTQGEYEQDLQPRSLIWALRWQTQSQIHSRPR